MRRRERHAAISHWVIGHSLVIGHCVIGHFTRSLGIVSLVISPGYWSLTSPPTGV